MNYTLRNLVVAALLMLVGIVAVISFIRGERQDLARGKQEVQVYVAAKDIPAGTPADELESGGYLDTKDVLREDAPPNALGKLDTIESLVSNDPIVKGDFVTYTAFNKTAGLKPTSTIKGNERLFAVPIPAANDIGGQIRPGDRVDLSASITSQSGGFPTRVMLGESIEVIDTPDSLRPDGVDAEAEAPDAEGSTKLYVLKATAEQAQYILWGVSAADDNGVTMLLNPASGSTDANVPPITKPEASAP